VTYQVNAEVVRKLINASYNAKYLAYQVNSEAELKIRSRR